MKKLLIVATALLGLLGAHEAQAQTVKVKVVASCGAQSLPTAVPNFLFIDVTGNLCVNATVSASVSGFAPNGNFATLTASASSGSVALPSGAVVVFENTGTTAVSCTLGIGSATATASEIVIQPSSGKPLTVGSNTFGACINQTGSASNVVVLSGGAGLATGWGGGSGGGGGGGAVTIADAADVTLGAKADAKNAATDTTAITLMQVMKEISFMEQNPASRAVTNATASNLKAQVDPLTSASWGLGAFGSAMPLNGQGIGLYDGTNMVRARGDETSGIWVNVKAGGGSGGTSSNFGSAFPTPGTAIGFTDGTNMVAGLAKAGNTAAPTDRAVIVADPNLLAAVEAPLAGSNLAAGIGSVGIVANGAGGFGWSGGSNTLNALSTTPVQVKGTTGQLAKLMCNNPNASTVFVQAFDVAAATTPTLGTTVPTHNYPIAASTVGGFALASLGDQFSNGLKVAATTLPFGTVAPGTALTCDISWN